MILEVTDIHTFYGSSHILFGVLLAVDRGEVVCLLGRNGAGKTTTLRSIMGLTAPRSGNIRYKGEDITGKPPFVIARGGIGYVPEDRRIFPDLTVRENLELAQNRRTHGDAGWTIEKVRGLFPVLRDRDKHRGEHLSGGEQQMLAIGRALMVNPDLLLLDEPSEGLSLLVRRNLGEQIRRLKEAGTAILLAEQNAKFALRISDRAYVIEKGRICYEGGVAELTENEQARKRWLAL